MNLIILSFLFIQATAEQIRLAQMISDHNDADFEEKVKQLVDITGKDQDESMIALHDCNGDVNRAINVLLEGSPDTDSWEMVGKKKGVSGQKESAQTDGGDEGKENREKGGERDVARRRGGAPRRGRGASRGRECDDFCTLLLMVADIISCLPHSLNVCSKNKIFICFFSTFNPADYTEPAQTEESYTSGSTWSNTGNLEPEDGNRLEFTGGEGTNYPRKFDSRSGAWRTGMRIVVSMPIPQENVTITAGQRIDLAVLLGKTPPSSSSEAEPASLEGPQPPSLSQSLVFSNSKQTAALSQSSSSAPYSQHSMVSMLSKGFGDVGDPKGTTGGSTTGSQFLEQFKTAQALAHLVAQHSQSGTPNAGPSTWDTSPPTLGQYDMKSHTEPVHSPFTKRQPYKPTSTSSSMDAFLQDKATPASTTSALPSQSTPSSLPQAITTPVPKPSGPTPGQQNSSSPADPQASSPLPLQQHKLKQQKKRASISTKIPALAVEMPGSADISGLNLQFGALQFGSEPVLPEYDAPAAVATTTPGNQGQNSLYTSARKAPPNLPPGVPPLLPNPYIMAPGLLHPYPPQVYGYDDLQMLQTRIPLDYYSIPFATPTTALTGREGSLTGNPYSAGDLSKFGRGDASSPAPATTLAQPQQTQTQTHHTTQQPFLNPALPPGYSYTSLPYYTGVPGLPNTFQYGPAMFPVAPTSSKQHGVNVGVNASATAFQQASGYGSHGYSTGNAFSYPCNI
uniref:Ubiquitin associated protein 2-like n=1 Tax=Cyprinus carpio TaxID=7962 RepID=A0A8C2AZG7_CYPCA